MGNWKTDYMALKFPPDKIPELKKEYAKLLAMHNRDSEKAFVDPQMAIIFNHDISAQLYAKNNWVYDPEIKNMVGYFLSEGLGTILPSKEEVCRLMFETALTSHNPKDKIVALKTYAELMGFDVEENARTHTTQNVILVTDNGDNLSWEEKMLRQQEQLKQFAEKQLASVENDSR